MTTLRITTITDDVRSTAASPTIILGAALRAQAMGLLPLQDTLDVAAVDSLIAALQRHAVAEGPALDLADALRQRRMARPAQRARPLTDAQHPVALRA